MIRLYRAPFSTNVERVALALAHKGLAVQSVVIDPSDRRPVREASGQDLVPVINDDGTVGVDSLRILRHLEKRHPDPPLLPPERARRAEIEVFLDWFDRVWKVAPNAIEAELGSPAPDATRIGALGGAMQGHLDLFERLLDGREHLMGALSMADLAAFPFLTYAAGRDPADDEAFHRILEEHQRLGEGRPALAAWIERMDALPRAL